MGLPENLISYAALELLVNSFIYAVFVIPAFLICWIWLKKPLQKWRIQAIQSAKNEHLIHDIKHSVITLMVFTGIDLVLFKLQGWGYTLIYFEVGDYGWAWFWLSIPIMMILHDTYFYWTHRAMHHPALYKYFHKVHHESTDPSPFTSFAFHPLEAIVENGIVFVFAFIMPVNFFALIIWQLLQMGFNVIGHLGYEIYPKWWINHPILSLKTPSTHHNMHHERFDGNYGLYFTWWDKWMGTEFKDYSETFRSVFEKENIKSSKQNPIQRLPNEKLVRATIAGRTYQFLTDGQKSLLDEGLAQGVPMKYGCRKGQCGICKMKCVEAELLSVKNDGLSKTEIEDNYFLMCQSFATSKEVHLES